jgi:rhamnosyltransferase
MTAQTSQGRPSVERIAALVVTYFPDRLFPERLDRLLEQAERVVVVDNGSDAASLAWRQRYEGRAGVTILENGVNLGIASALNRGVRSLAAEGYGWVLTLDQDSTIEEGCVAALLQTLAKDSNPGEVALVGANRRDLGAGLSEHRWVRPKQGPPFFERVPCDRIGPDGVTLVITSGTLTSVKAFERLGPFKDAFFIDFVDSEYCLRARKSGYRILVSCEARLDHRIGSKRQARLLGITISPMHHSPLRKYYIFRNAVGVIRSYGRSSPHWLVYQILALFEIIIGVLVFEDRKGAKLKACLTGLWDGLLGRGGPAQRAF